ncbi:TPA: translesion error-prone DNA polymerase V autoproteolytic subunit [Legionella pneumophila]|nr:translesion error-prone DNA polymerase V autoproteolytic subunit [Legionella pneumophila]
MSKGGRREGAGRPVGRGKFGFEATKQIRVPASKISEIHAFLLNESHSCSLPLFSSKVQAGFPSPADDYIERYLDLNSEFIKHPAATFLLRATGDSMIEAGIFSNDILVVDRSLEPVDGKIIIAALNGELTVKRLSCQNGKVQLISANPNYKPIDITGEEDMVIWGVVTLVLHEPF